MAVSVPPAVVAVTGAAGYVGRRLIAHLAAQPPVRRIIATDVRPLPETHPKVTFLQQDITAPLGPAFQEHGVQAVVHLAFVLRQMRDRRVSQRVNLEGAASVLRACQSANVRRIIVLSSSTVYGPHPDNPVPLDEEAPCRPPRAFHYAWDKAASERLFQDYASAHPGTKLSILRSCVVMGPSASPSAEGRASNFITSALFKPLLVGVRGHDPPLQFLHEDDLMDLLWRFVAESHPGVFNMAGPGTVRWSQLARMAGRRLVWLPAAIAYPLTHLAWWLRLQNDSPGVGLNWVRYPWVVGTARLERELGYRFKHTSEAALRSYLESRP